MSLKIHLTIDETEIYRWRGSKVEEKSLWKLKNELIIVLFYDFCSFMLNVINILGKTERTDNVLDVSLLLQSASKLEI